MTVPELKLPDLEYILEHWKRVYVYYSPNSNKYTVLEGTMPEGPALINCGPTGIILIICHGTIIYENKPETF